VPASRRAALAARYRARLFEPAQYRRDRNALPPPRADTPERPFLMQFTSGTTGEPKAMLSSHGQFAGRSLRAALAYGITPDDRLVSARPWPELVGMRYALRMHCIGGAFVNVAYPGTRGELAEAISAYGVTMMSASPAQLRRLLAEDGDPVELHALSVEGAPVAPREVIAARERLCRNTQVVYGANETASIAVLRPGDPVGPAGRVGRLLPDVQCESVDGELRLRVPWMTESYFDNPEATAARFRDGWFHPGDAGSIDADGFLTLHGRLDDTINVGGVKVMPSEIEAVLLEHPDVADAAVVGLAHDRRGEIPVALVVMRGPAQRRELEDHCRARIDLSRRPQAILAIESIPRNTAGKVDRQQLRSIAAALVAPGRGRNS
jgi:acyl-coenzyme A synthetase/AMP-(fatty) acid ligase